MSSPRLRLTLVTVALASAVAAQRIPDTRIDRNSLLKANVANLSPCFLGIAAHSTRVWLQVDATTTRHFRRPVEKCLSESRRNLSR